MQIMSEDEIKDLVYLTNEMTSYVLLKIKERYVCCNDIQKSYIMNFIRSFEDAVKSVKKRDINENKVDTLTLFKRCIEGILLSDSYEYCGEFVEDFASNIECIYNIYEQDGKNKQNSINAITDILPELFANIKVYLGDYLDTNILDLIRIKVFNRIPNDLDVLCIENIKEKMNIIIYDVLEEMIENKRFDIETFIKINNEDLVSSFDSIENEIYKEMILQKICGILLCNNGKLNMKLLEEKIVTLTESKSMVKNKLRSVNYKIVKINYIRFINNVRTVINRLYKK